MHSMQQSCSVSTTNVHSFQAIVFAAGQGSRLTGLVSSQCKALLPIANYPMIYFPIKQLICSGFTDIILVVLETSRHEIEKVLISLFSDNKSLNFTYVETNEDDDLGTIDALRKVHSQGHIKSENILLISCDLILKMNLHLLTDLHAKKHAALTVLLANQSQPGSSANQEQLPCPGKRSKHEQERDIIGCCADASLFENERRLVYFQSEEDLGKHLELSISNVLSNYHELDVFSDLLDSHLYIISNRLLLYLLENLTNHNLTMFKGEFLPQYINKDQYLSDVHNLFLDEKLQTADDHLTLSHIYSHSMGEAQFEPWSVFAYVLQPNSDHLCLRTNTIAGYVEANRSGVKFGSYFFPTGYRLIDDVISKKLERNQTGADVLIDCGTIVGEKATLKRSVVGKNCSLGRRVKITNSILMHEVSVGDDCVIMNSILSSSVELEASCELKDCVVESGLTLLTNTKHKAEVIMKKNLMSTDAAES